MKLFVWVGVSDVAVELSQEIGGPGSGLGLVAGLSTYGRSKFPHSFFQLILAHHGEHSALNL